VHTNFLHDFQSASEPIIQTYVPLPLLLVNTHFRIIQFNCNINMEWHTFLHKCAITYSHTLINRFTFTRDWHEIRDIHAICSSWYASGIATGRIFGTGSVFQKLYRYKFVPVKRSSFCTGTANFTVPYRVPYRKSRSSKTGRYPWYALSCESYDFYHIYPKLPLPLHHLPTLKYFVIFNLSNLIQLSDKFSYDLSLQDLLFYIIHR